MHAHPVACSPSLECLAVGGRRLAIGEFLFQLADFVPRLGYALAIGIALANGLHGRLHLPPGLIQEAFAFLARFGQDAPLFLAHLAHAFLVIGFQEFEATTMLLALFPGIAGPHRLLFQTREQGVHFECVLTQ